MLNARGEERAAFWEAIRSENAQRRRDISPTIGKGIRITPVLGAAERIAGAALKPLDVVGNALESLFAPTLTPKQKRDAARTAAERATEAADKLDLAQYLAEREAARQRQEQEREVARQRTRDGRDR